MDKLTPGIDYGQPVSDALKVILDNKSDDPEEMRRLHAIVRQAFAMNRDSLPYPMYNIGRRLIEHAIEDALQEREYQDLFSQFADEPYMLAKILIKKDPDRFFDFFTVAWGVRKTLPEYVAIDEDDPPESDEFGGNGGGGPEEEPGDHPRIPPADVVERIRENLEYLDEEDIFEMAIPLFKQSADKEKDGFRKGYEELLALFDDVDDPEQVATIERVFDRFSELIDMEFGHFKPHLRRKNFPYITVRRAIKTMEEVEDSGDGRRRFAHFDTRTGKTSLALLEPEYLGKERALYVCPPDTIPTVVNEYKSYGGDLTRLYVARTGSDIEDFMDNSEGIKYCIVPTSLVASGAFTGNGGESMDDMIEGEEEVEIDQDDENGNGHAIADMRQFANPALVQLMQEWCPDYMAVDEARHFTGYHCGSSTLSSKRSRALLYLLNNPETIESEMTVRLMDATPGDLPRHFYPLLSMMYPQKYPMPEDARDTLGNQPYLLSSVFEARADQATHDQVYERPPVRTIKESDSIVEMSDAQSAIYDFASRYSTPDILHRITLARIATFNPSVLRPAFRKLLKTPISKEDFKERFDHVYKTWKRRSKTEDIPFDWDYVARSGDRELLLHLFSFEPELFESYINRRGEKLDTMWSLYESDEVLSCKARYVVHRLKEIVEKAEAGERHPSRVIIYSTFKRGLTRELLSDEAIPLKLEQFLCQQIQEKVPEVNTFMLDGGVSTKSDKTGVSPRDSVRRAWSVGEGINVLFAVGPATCQGVDLTAPGHMIEEIHMDTSMDSRQDYQVNSRSLGPRQNRSVTKRVISAVTATDRFRTIDTGIGDLVTSKYLLRNLVCRGVSMPASFLEAAEDNRTFLGEFCEPEKDEEEVTNGIRGRIKSRLSAK